MKKYTLQIAIALLPVIMTQLFTYYKNLNEYNFRIKLIEDSIMEWTQVALYVLLIIILLAVIRIKKQTGPKLQYRIISMFTGMMIIVLAEELNWGQRLLGYATPEYFLQHNAQKEVSFHNFKTFHYAMNDIYLMIFAIGFMLCLTASHIPLIKHIKLHDIAPRWYLASYFAYAYIYCYNLKLLQDDGKYVPWPEQEIAELFFVMACVFHATGMLYHAKKFIKTASSDTP